MFDFNLRQVSLSTIELVDMLFEFGLILTLEQLQDDLLSRHVAFDGLTWFELWSSKHDLCEQFLKHIDVTVRHDDFSARNLFDEERGINVSCDDVFGFHLSTEL